MAHFNMKFSLSLSEQAKEVLHTFSFWTVIQIFIKVIYVFLDI